MISRPEEPAIPYKTKTEIPSGVMSLRYGGVAWSQLNVVVIIIDQSSIVRVL